MSHGPIGDEASAIFDDEFDSGRSAVRIASVAALGGLLFGYDSAVINGAVKSIQEHFLIDDRTLGLAVASALLGAAVGAMTAGRVADHVGRLTVMKVAALLFLISALGAGLAQSVSLLVVFRVIGGLGVGFASVIAPAYIAETSPASIRGRLGSLQQLAIVSGIFLALAIDALLAKLAGGAGHELWLGQEAWRWMFLSMTIPAVVYGLLAFTIPESPRYLVASHRIPEARKVLTTLLGEKNLEITLDRIQQTLDTEEKPSWRDMCRPGRGPFNFYGIVWVGLALSVFQQFVGINVIFYYSNVLWEAVGFDESSSFIITVITSVVNILTTVVAIMLIDKIGRRPLLLIGSAGMTLTLATMAVIFGIAPQAGGVPQLNGIEGPIALVAANLFVVAFGMSWGPVVWVLLGEMFPNRIRAAALGLAAAGQWVANWLITVTFPELRSMLGVAYGFYAVCAFLSLVFVAKWVRETKGVALEDMHAELLEA
ncbi:sugar porter family MFS transporter [Mycobacterium sp. CBMA293]|uniref:sugar porter family MFS transporter n=1 Tax=unclassified Mycolicibacterium TaxID=2636767 RepID=UPI0012DE1EA2|nr:MULTISPECIES: sugar porter family MFS transporter [unclassified Mycolicibacterium]MUL49643.1 sugar porter family MFS transporter [Mycolicibacterium sp. CBMA 360]MUL60078.1 sugar porter family MFS transporter [Mycolicibacterium sp. CBMA 335]MUL72865.1 sugar porter family MFS transporter [Mycolicibacterium sp. CBMA 311]MUL96160.1 sugar porter family MFS transporter [Mycolicibacterium sp. CBMA 230]MUM08174.1 MFS transporter [Mycolicibacterium sp. CBMA 213]